VAGPHKLLAVILIPAGSSLFHEGKIPFYAEPGQSAFQRTCNFEIVLDLYSEIIVSMPA
jgi:hypothetical protein